MVIFCSLDFVTAGVGAMSMFCSLASVMVVRDVSARGFRDDGAVSVRAARSVEDARRDGA